MERRNAVVRLHENQEQSSDDRKTFIILGVPRGGTSAIAGSVQRLGVFLGDDLPNNHEDPNFVEQENAHMLSVIAQRNKAYNVWGWKYPRAQSYLEELKDELVNPHLIVVFRDAVSTMKGQTRWHTGMNQYESVNFVLSLQQKNWNLIKRWKVPTAIVSYEKAIMFPRVFIRQISHFIHNEHPEHEKVEQIVEFLKPLEYKPAET